MNKTPVIGTVFFLLGLACGVTPILAVLGVLRLTVDPQHIPVSNLVGLSMLLAGGGIMGWTLESVLALLRLKKAA